MKQTIVDRRHLLRSVTLGSLALSAALLAGCAGSIPPRQVKRTKSHITGGNSRGGKGRARGVNLSPA
jgi:hypothetical protein